MKCSAYRLAGLVALLLGVMSFSRSGLGATITYDVGSDFSNTQNGGSNPWSYGYITSGDLNVGNFTLFTYDSGSQWLIQNQSDPNVFHNAGGASGAYSGFYAAANAVILGPYQGPTVVEWTAPSAGTIDLTSSGQNIQACCGGDNSRGVYYDVFVGGSDSGIGGPQYVGPNSSGSVDPNNLPTATYNQSNITVTPGETIAFVAYNGGNGSNNSMQLNATIDFTAVPEPSSLALAGLGALGLSARRHRKF